MDKRRQELEELQDDTHLALLMDEYAESMGAQVRAEAEKAFENGEITIPQELDDACATILAQSSKADNHNKSTKTLVRYCMVAAATVVVLIGMLMVAQAAGINVFGRLASWTDSVFHYSSEKKPAQAEEEPFAEIEAALRDLSMPVELAPHRMPDGYLVSSMKESETDVLRLVAIVLEKDGKEGQIVIEEYLDMSLIENSLWEKSDPSAKVFSSNDRDFYLIENEQGWSGTWSDGRYNISLFGFESIEDIKSIIQSIGVP